MKKPKQEMQLYEKPHCIQSLQLTNMIYLHPYYAQNPYFTVFVRRRILHLVNYFNLNFKHCKTYFANAVSKSNILLINLSRSGSPNSQLLNSFWLFLFVMLAILIFLL